MRDGRIEQAGAPLELYDRPANQFVAGFIGSPAMNFLPGTVHGSGAGASVTLDGGTVLPMPPGAAGADGQRVVYGVRPEHLALAAPGQSGGIEVDIVTLEPTGADTFVACRHQGSEMICVFRERHDFSPGSRIRLIPDVSRCHVFDAQSGQRLTS